MAPAMTTHRMENVEHGGITAIAERAAARRCPVCDEDNTKAPANRFSSFPWRLKTCRSCSMVYLENAPPYEALESDLAWERTSRAEKQRRRANRRLHYFVSDGLKSVKRMVRRGGRRAKERTFMTVFVQPGPVLDVGCGEGVTFLGLPSSYIPYGVEISRELAALSNAEYQKHGGRVIQASAVEGIRGFEDGFFTGIMMRAFLEHEACPGELLREAHRALRPGGVAIIKVPNFASLNRTMKGSSWCGFRHPDHANYFSPTTLRTIVLKAGFQVKRFGVLDHFPLNDNMWMVIARPR